MTRMTHTAAVKEKWLTHTVAIKEKWLSDGSAVYSVELSEYGPHETSSRLAFDAVDRGAAFRLAEKLAALLNDNHLALASVETRDHTYS